MNFIKAPALLLYLAAVPCSLATVLTIGPTNETITLTGLGANAAGNGRSSVSLGACSFDGVNTTCTLTGPFTGLGNGTFQIVLKYLGNGVSPVTFTSISPGNDTISATLSGGSLETTLNKSDGTSVTFYYTFFNFLTVNATCTKVVTCGPGQVGLTPGATLTENFTASLDVTPMINNVISAGQYGGFSALAPGTWMEIYGYNVGTVLARTWGGADFTGNLAPTNLAGTTVTVGGKPAFVDYVSPSQVNAQVPTGIGTGRQPVIVTTAGGSSAPTMVTVNAVEPGLLAPTAFQLSGGQYVAALLPDGLTFILPPGVTTAVRTTRARAGDTIILYGVGFGPVTPDNPAGQITTQLNTTQSPVQISFGGVPAKVNYSGMVSGYVGLYQFNVVVPNVASGDAVPVTFTLGGVQGPQNLVIPIQ